MIAVHIFAGIDERDTEPDKEIAQHDKEPHTGIVAAALAHVAMRSGAITKVLFMTQEQSSAMFGASSILNSFEAILKRKDGTEHLF
jgi:hypothetical protein